MFKSLLPFCLPLVLVLCLALLATSAEEELPDETIPVRFIGASQIPEVGPPRGASRPPKTFPLRHPKTGRLQEVPYPQGLRRVLAEDVYNREC